MTRWWLRTLFAGLLAVLTATSAWADRAEELARIHLEAIGGRARLEALQSLRVTGRIRTQDEEVRFTMTSARPNRVRMETFYPKRTLVQGTDGVAPPWEMDPAVLPARYTAMEPATAQDFLSDAEFDDPLVGGEARGFQLEFGGEMEIEGRKLLRLLVARRLRETFFVFLDPETYFIVLRIDQTKSASGQTVELATRYADFRPVQGVLVAHEVKVYASGKLSQHAVIERVDANPRVRPETFSAPVQSRAATR